MTIDKNTPYLAREWAKKISLREKITCSVDGETLAAAEVIAALPDEWVDASELRYAISAWEFSNISAAEFVDMVRDALPTPPAPRTLADMTPEEREACQWMQADVKLANGGSATCVIANPRVPGARVRVWAPHGGSDDIEEGRVTPLPDLPRMVWPGSEPEETHFDTPEQAPLTSGCDDNGARVTLEQVAEADPAYIYTDSDGDEWEHLDGRWTFGGTHAERVAKRKYGLGRDNLPEMYGPYTRIEDAK